MIQPQRIDKRSPQLISSLVTQLASCVPCVLAAAGFIAIQGCSHPLKTASEERLSQSLLGYTTREWASVPNTDITLSRPPSTLRDQFSEAQLDELDQSAGPASYTNAPLNLGPGLSGNHMDVMQINLHEAIVSAIKNNLTVQGASYTPGMSEADIVSAEAQFDTVMVSQFQYTKSDQPGPSTTVSGFITGTGVSASEQVEFGTGFQQNLVTGGRIDASTVWQRSDNQSPGVSLVPDPSYTASVQLAVAQPLLRGFGSEVNLAQVRLSRNAHRSEIETFRNLLLATAHETESAYWTLYAARQVLRIRERLLERGRETSNKLQGRQSYDAKPSEIADAKARVQAREIRVLRTREEVINASDRLKQLMNAQGLEVANEILVVPVDGPIDAPITFNYSDALKTAVQRRPEIKQAIVAIDDASIRQMLNDNLRLPRLDVQASIRWNGLDDELNEAYSGLTDDDFIDYLLGATLEFPLGNRDAQAKYRAARLARQQSIIAYQRSVQNIVIEVKSALRLVRLNYELLERTRDSRLAASEALRTIIVQEELEAAMTPEFLNLKFNRQESLATAEVDEINAVIQYQIALSSLYYVMGIALERNQIEFVVPR